MFRKKAKNNVQLKARLFPDHFYNYLSHIFVFNKKMIFITQIKRVLSSKIATMNKTSLL